MLQFLNDTGPCDTTVVSIAEGLSKRLVEPKNEALVADPSLRMVAVPAERTARTSDRPAAFAPKQCPQRGCLELVSPPIAYEEWVRARNVFMSHFWYTTSDAAGFFLSLL